MFISRMNRFLDRHGKVAILTIAVVMIIPFLFMWGPSSNLFRGETNRKSEMGRVFGESVTVTDFLRQVFMVDMRYRQFTRQRDQWPHEIRAFQDTIIAQAMTRLRLLHEARQRNLHLVSNDELTDHVFELFSADGEFQENAYNGLLAEVRMKLGLSQDEVMGAFRDELIIARLTEQVNSTVFVSELEARQEALKAYEKFNVSVARYEGSTYKEEVNLQPDPETVEAYYQENKDELKLPPRKRVRVAVIPFADPDHDITVSEAKIDERIKLMDPDTPEEELEAARQEIKQQLVAARQKTEAQKKAQQLIGRMIRTFETQREDANGAAILAKHAEELGLRIVDSGPFSKYTPIPNIGRIPELQKKAYAVSEDNPLSPLVISEDKGKIYLAAWLETIPSEKPPGLTEELRRKIADDMVVDRLREFYNKHVEPFRPYAAAGITPETLRRQITRRALEDLPKTELNEMAPEVAERQADDYYAEYYVPRQKNILVASFAFDSFQDEVQDIQEGDLRSYYESHKDEYKVDDHAGDDLDNEDGDPVYKPFAEVRNSIRKKMIGMRAKMLALESASQFSYDADMAVLDLDDDRKVPAAFEKMAAEAGRDVRETGWLTPGNGNAVLGDDPDVSAEAFDVTADNPVSDAIEGPDAYYVVCWLATKPGRLPQFDQAPGSLHEKAKEQLLLKEAVRMAKSKAESAYEILTDSLAEDDVDFALISPDWDFEELPEFTLRSPPPVADSRTIIETATQASSGELSEPADIHNGALLVYVADRTMPVGDELDEKAEEMYSMLVWRKQNAAMDNLTERLRAADSSTLDADLAKAVLNQ